MRIFTPTEVASAASNKYLGVLISAKFARYVNEFPRDRSLDEKKLTTQSLEAIVQGDLGYRLIHRQPQET